jgi:hypothetical protein
MGNREKFEQQGTGPVSFLRVKKLQLNIIRTFFFPQGAASILSGFLLEVNSGFFTLIAILQFSFGWLILSRMESCAVPEARVFAEFSVFPERGEKA